MARANGKMRNAAVDPDVNRVVAMTRSFGEPEFAGEGGIVQLKPNIGTALGDEVGGLPNQARVENRLILR